MDDRDKILAKNLVNYSINLQKGEKVWVSHSGYDTKDLVKEIIREIYDKGGIPYVTYSEPEITRELLLGATKEQLELLSKIDCEKMENMDCYIGIRSGDNISELSDVPAEKMSLYNKIYSTPVHHNIRVLKTKWVVLRYPNGSMAQLNNTSTESFRNFYYDVCNLNYKKMSNAMEKLKDIMDRTDKVKIVSPGTNLTFSIKDIPAICCAGHMNIPDGEVYTAPVRDSVNGTISYNTPSVYQGFEFSNIVLTFKDGKIVDAKANDSTRINKIFDTDDGARYIGEFAIGVNPYITKPMKDILFDEKISGSIHFTPGSCYDDANNYNNSAIHWDLVLIQTNDYGGGQIYFDDVLIRDNGLFVLDELKCLNPENLK